MLPTPEEWETSHDGEVVTKQSKHGCPEITCLKCGSRAHVEKGEAITMDDGDGSCEQSYSHYY